MSLRILPLKNLAKRHEGLTPEIAACFLQAAGVCLDKHHISPVNFLVEDYSEKYEVQVSWRKTDSKTQGAWANRSDRIRDGAYACAIAAVEEGRKLFAVQRAETLTGADYYVAPSEASLDDLESWSRLEVSGTDLNKTEVRSRLKKKVSQTIKGISNLPAIAVIVGFKVKLIVMKSIESE